MKGSTIEWEPCFGNQGPEGTSG